jgi:RNA recognition motif-containing protein
MQTGLAMFNPSFNGEAQPQINMMHTQEDNALYVGNLSASMTDPILYQYFQPFGKVAST